VAGTITTGGLASGIDTNSLIDKLVQLQSRPLEMARTRQSGFRSQISILGDLASKLGALETAAKGLSSGGVLGLKASSTHTGFSAVPASGAVAGSYRIQVTELAQAAKERSLALATGQLVAHGTIQLTVQGTSYSVSVGKDGGDADPANDQPATLEDVAHALRTSAPVSAVVITNGTQRYLSVTPLQSGHPAAGAAAALSIGYTRIGTTGETLAFDPLAKQTARNATFTVDGLEFSRQSNVVSDALPGTTLTLKAKGGAAEDLVLDNDPEATKAKLQGFVDAYNGVLRIVQRELAVTDKTNRATTLAGDATLRSLQGRLQKLVSSKVTENGLVRTLADVGLKTQTSDGSLTIDSTALAGAIARDPAALNGLFSTATTGLQALTSTLVQDFTRSGDGHLTARKDSLDQAAKRIDADLIRMQARVDSYRENLVKQFTAMEEAVSKMKSSGSFLAMQDATFAKKS
jgi:flagellar hook-associated protein 2